MAVLLFRHALTFTNGDGDDDASTVFFVSEIIMFSFNICFYGLAFSPCLMLFSWLAAFRAACCWISVAMLCLGMGRQFSPASKAETGSTPIIK